MLVELQAPVEVGAGFDWSLAFVGDRSAVQQRASAIVDRLELHPDVERVNRSAGKEVADLARPDDDSRCGPTRRGGPSR